MIIEAGKRRLDLTSTAGLLPGLSDEGRDSVLCWYGDELSERSHWLTLGRYADAAIDALMNEQWPGGLVATVSRVEGDHDWLVTVTEQMPDGSRAGRWRGVDKFADAGAALRTMAYGTRAQIVEIAG